MWLAASRFERKLANSSHALAHCDPFSIFVLFFFHPGGDQIKPGFLWEETGTVHSKGRSSTACLGGILRAKLLGVWAVALACLGLRRLPSLFSSSRSPSTTLPDRPSRLRAECQGGI